MTTPDLKPCPLRYYGFLENVEESPNSMVAKLVAKAVDMADDAILQECINVAREAGVANLYLLDKKFVADAIREKMEREGLM